MGRPMYLLSLVAVCLAALVACPSPAAGWPVDSSFYDEIKRIVYGNDNAAAASSSAADADSAATDSTPPPPLSLPLAQASST